MLFPIFRSIPMRVFGFSRRSTSRSRSRRGSRIRVCSARFSFRGSYTVLDEATGDNGRVDNVMFLERMRECLEPAAASMHLSNQTLHLMHQGLFTLTKMRRSPSRGRQVLKLARQEYFPVAWDLHGLAATLGYLPRDVHRSWANAVGKVQTRDRDVQSDDSGKRRRPRRRRPRRRR